MAVCAAVGVLSYDSVFFVVHVPQLHQWIKVAVYVALLGALASGWRRAPSVASPVLVLFAVFVAYLLIPSTLAGPQSLVVWAKTALRISCLFLFCLLFARIDLKVLRTVFAGIGVLLGTQSIILYVLIVGGWDPVPSLVERFGPDDLFVSYGPLGFANWVLPNAETGVASVRAQSFFGEATRFAMFQMFPLAAALGSPRLGVGRLVAALIITVSIVLTFSVTAAAGVIAAGVMLLGLGSGQGRIRVARLVVLLVVAGSLVFGYYRLSRQIFESVGRTSNPVLSAMGRPEGSVNVRMDWVRAAMEEMLRRPWGIGMELEEGFSAEHGRLPLAPVQWFLRGGILGGLCMLGIQLVLIRRWFLPGLRSPDRAERMTAAACVALFVSGSVQGNWTDVLYLVPIAALIGARAAAAAAGVSPAARSAVPLRTLSGAVAGHRRRPSWGH